MFHYNFGFGIVRASLTLQNLTTAWSKGAKVWLQDGCGTVYSGLILGLRVESGYCVHNPPKGFLIDIQTDADVAEVLVRV